MQETPVTTNDPSTEGLDRMVAQLDTAGDMTTNPDENLTDVDRRIAEIQERYGPEDIVTFFIRQAQPELVAAVQRTEERLRAAGIGQA
ncbi:MAG TPA: hypothetical protein VGR06_11310 [Actinophytocola sp.]|jgi:hypothetical protein|uniref:hypothetical protein n=1 Tax=Actinophytocola sp. TaxID=1872138 RepID=UPI002E03BF94|nr:hypothetical protein [Actinophytocola sp.]